MAKKPSLKEVELAGEPVSLLDVATLIDTLDAIALQSLTARYSNGRELRPFRTGFELES